MTDELVQAILLPGLEPGAADVFLEFICYSGGPLPEELLPQVKVIFRTHPCSWYLPIDRILLSISQVYMFSYVFLCYSVLFWLPGVTKIHGNR